MRQTLSMVAMATFFAIAMSGTLQAQQNEPITLSVIAAASKMEHQREIAERFMEEHPSIRIEYRVSGGDYNEVIQQVLQDSIAGTPPDAGFFGNFTLRTLVDRDLAVPLDQFIEAEANWKEMGYRPAMMSVGEVDGKQIGIPFSVSLPILYYNADLVRAAGADLESFAETWDGVIELAREIHERNANVAGMWMRYQPDTWYWQALVFSKGGAMLNEDETEVAFTGEQGEWAIDLLWRMGQDTGYVDMGTSQALQAFNAGAIGIIVGSSAMLEGLLEQTEGKFELGTARFPELTEESRLPAGGNAAVILAQDPERQKAAWEFIKFATGPVGQTLMVKDTGYMSVNDLPLDDPEMLGSYYEEEPDRRTAVSQADYITGWYAFPGPNGLKIDELMVRHQQDVVNQRAEPKPALEAMASEVQALLPEAGQ